MAIIRVNPNDYQKGEAYIARVQRETDRNFEIFLSLLSSYWQSTIDGPNYTNHIKAMSIALGELRVLLEDVLLDNRYTLTRGEFLYQIMTSVIFPYEDGFPDLDSTDIDFRSFLMEIIKIYFKGSIPSSIEKAFDLIFESDIKVRENYKNTSGNTGFDISDQFGFTVDIIVDDLNNIDVFRSDKNIRLILRFIRPAHTLYRIKYVLSDSYSGNQNNGNQVPDKAKKVLDQLSCVINEYSYDDFRKFTYGIYNIDENGSKKPMEITGEVHSGSEFYLF